MKEMFHIHLTRGKEKRTIAVPCTSEYIKGIVNRTFRGRFSKPEKLSVNDGVKLIIANSGRVLIGRRIYNKSVFQCFTALEKAIENTPL